MGSIDWVPIEDIPDAQKDGRVVLLWDRVEAITARWRNEETRGWFTGFVSSMDGDLIMVEDPSHFAEIAGPAA